MRQLQTKPLISCTKVDLFYMRGVYSMGHVLAYFCHDKHVFVVTKLCLFCHNKIMFVVTKLVATRRFLSPQKTFFVITNMCLSQQTCVCRDKSMLVVMKSILVAAPTNDSPLCTSTTWTTSFYNHRLCIALVSMSFCKEKNYIHLCLNQSNTLSKL